MADIELFKQGMSPNKLFEYMAAGIPVVTNAGGFAAQIVQGSGCGVATPFDGIGQGVQEILELSPEERRTWGRAGTEWLRRNASRDIMSGRLLVALELACTPYGAPPREEGVLNQ